MRVLEALLPLTRSDGQMVIVASAMGVFKSLPESVRSRFNTTDHNSQEINNAMDPYVDAAELSD